MTKNNQIKAKRNTVQGRMIFNVLELLKGSHPSALAIHRELKKEYPGISTATVYSHLRRLAEDGKIRVLSCLGSADRFDMVVEEHYHIKCELCGALSDLHIDAPGGINEIAEKLSGYIVKGHNTIFYGVCPDCKEKQ